MRRIDDWGIEVPTGSRLPRAIDIVGRGLDEPVAAPEVVTECAKTVLDLYFITHAQDDRPSRPVLNRLTAALSGGDLVQSDADHRPRDVQFELEIWAMFRVGAVEIIFEEPDLVFTLGTARIGIAVKRIWSVEQAHKSLSRAAGQIARSGVQGLIATNVQQYLKGVDAELQLAAKGRTFNIDVRRMHGQLAYLAKKKHVLGIMLRGTGTRAGEDMPGQPRRNSVSTYMQTFMFLSDDDPRDFPRMFDQIGQRLKEWYRDNL